MTRHRLTHLLDNRKGGAHEQEVDSAVNGENEKEFEGDNKACSEPTGSELCSVLVSIYDNAQSQSSQVPDEEKTLVPAVLSCLLALSHSAKHTALQGGDNIIALK